MAAIISGAAQNTDRRLLPSIRLTRTSMPGSKSFCSCGRLLRNGLPYPLLSAEKSLKRLTYYALNLRECNIQSGSVFLYMSWSSPVSAKLWPSRPVHSSRQKVTLACLPSNRRTLFLMHGPGPRDKTWYLSIVSCSFIRSTTGRARPGPNSPSPMTRFTSGGNCAAQHSGRTTEASLGSCARPAFLSKIYSATGAAS